MEHRTCIFCHKSKPLTAFLRKDGKPGRIAFRDNCQKCEKYRVAQYRTQGRLAGTVKEWQRWKDCAKAAGLSTNRWLQNAANQRAELEEAIMREEPAGLSDRNAKLNRTRPGDIE